MHNLLLDKDKQKIKKEYRTGLLVVFFSFLAFLGVIFFLSLLPTAIFTWSKENDVLGKKQAIEQSTISVESQEDLNSMIMDMKEKVESLEKGRASLPLDAILEKILAHKNAGISITGFVFHPEDAKKIQVTIQGTANTRDTLVGFSKSLEGESMFTVSLPVSNFAKQNNIDFILDIFIQAK